MWRGLNVAFRDVLVAILFAFLLAALAAVPERPTGAANSIQPQGDVVIQMSWDKAVDADVDLWVQAPGDVPVGYSNQGGLSCNLLKDDLGYGGMPLAGNEEMTICRGILSGEYTVNAHLYRSRDNKYPIKVHALVITRAADGTAHQVLAEDTDLLFEGQETTFFRFALDKTTGALLPGSVNRLHKALRAAQGKAE